MGARLEIITGRAGTGKTAALFSRAADIKKAGGGGECFVIVPEQATFIAELGLARVLGGGLFGCTVTSWKGLARRMLDSIGEKRAFLTAEGRVMLVRRCTDIAAKDLTVFKRSAAHRGFPGEMDGLIAKFKRCGLRAEDVRRAAESFEEHDPLRDRLSDIALIFGELEARCSSRYIDSEDMVARLVEKMSASGLVGSHVFIDGGDTMHEYAFPIFAGLLRCAQSVTITLTTDTGSRDRALFSEEEAVLSKLYAAAEEAGVRPLVTRLTGRKRPGTKAMLHMERELFSPSPAVFRELPEGLSAYTAPNRLDEVTEAAERIRKAAEGGMSYRDMAVIVSDFPGYAPIVKRVFRSCGIPYFADVSRSLVTYPAAGLILSALTAAEKNYEAGYVLDCVKSGYLPVTDEEAELFENCLVKTGVTGKRLLEPFEGELSELEDVRRRIMEPLARFKENLSENDSASRTKAIHAFLGELDVYGKQKELCAKLHEKSLFTEEEENAQVLNTIIEVLDQLYVIMGGEPIGLKRFTAVVREGFEAHEIGMIPSTCDQVMVGSIDRTRMSEVKLLIVLGMNEGLFPRPRKDDGVIDDGDLLRLREKGFELWKSSKRLADGDVLAVYKALAKAKEEIVFCCPVSIVGAGSMDAAAAPCKLLNKLGEIFPNLPKADGVYSPRERSCEELAFFSLSGSLRRMADTGRKDENTARLAAWFMKRPGYKPLFKRITDGMNGEAPLKPLGTELASRLYGRVLYGSASRLESFNGCPFRHFVEYGLKAEERGDRKQKNTDLGSFYHEVLEAFVSEVIEKGLDWKELNEEAVDAILRGIVPHIMKNSGYLLLDTARQRSRIRTVTETARFTCYAVTKQFALGRFRPNGCEVTFGYEDSLFPPLRIDAGGASFFIRGKIDRVDKAGEMTRIVDYKSGGKEFDFAELREGLQLQLPLYAAAVRAADTVAMYYMPIRNVDPVTDESGEAVKEMSQKVMKDFMLNGVTLREADVIAATEEFEKSSTVVKMSYSKDGVLTGSGLVSRGEFGYAMDFAERKAARTLERILEGEIAIRPTNKVRAKKLACRFCPYMDVCLFDPELKKEGAKDIYPMSADAFFGRNELSRE